MNEKQRLEKVLGWVNRKRHYYYGGNPLKNLRKGKQFHAGDNVIHNCFFGEKNYGVLSYKTMTFIDGWGIEIKHPKFVQDFIDDFDSGKYPNLIKRG